MTRNNKGILAVLAIAAVSAALLHESLFMGKGLGPADAVLQLSPWAMDFGRPPSNPLLADQYFSFIPLRRFAYVQGGFPLWNPFVACGVPAAAWIQSASLYPINLLLHGVEPFRADGWAAFLKLFLAGVFSFLYLRRLGAGWAASLLSGLCFPLSGFMIVWLGHPHMNGACLLPACAYFLEWALTDWETSGRRASWKPWAALAATYGCVMLGGHPPTAIHISFFIVAYTYAKRLARPVDYYLWGRLAAVLGCGALMAAPSILPYLEYRNLAFTGRSAEGPARAATTRLSLSTLLHWGLPFLSGSPSLGFEGLGSLLKFTIHDNFNERTGYVGILPPALALWAVIRRTRASSTIVTFHAACAAFCLAVVYGLPPLPRLLGAIPVLKDISHMRLLLFVCFSLCVLAGLGLDSLLAEKNREQRLAFAAACGLGVLLYLWLVFEVVRPELPRLGAEEKAFLLNQLPVLIGGVAVLCLAVLKPFAFRWDALCVAWALFDSLRFAWGYNPSVPRELYYPTTEAIRRVQAQPGPFRILGMGWTLLPDTPLFYGLQDLRSQDVNIAMSRYEELITGRSGSFTFYPSADVLPPLLGALNVKYVLAEPSWSAPPKMAGKLKKLYGREVDVYEVQGSVERAIVVKEHQVLAAPEILARMRSGEFDPRRALLLEKSPGPGSERFEASRPGVAAARILSYAPEEVRVEARSPTPAFVLLLDTYYPGWKAEVNGRPGEILRADYNFRAVAIPAGLSEIRFFYQPLSVRAGYLLALIGCALVAAMALRRR